MKSPRIFLALLLAFTGSIHFGHAADFALRADGTILKDGQTFFPFGFYSSFEGLTEAEGLAALDAIGAGGFNLVELRNNAIPNSPPNYPLFALLDRAAARGVWVILATSSNNVTGGTQVTYASNPAIMAWEVNDDADDGRWTLAEARSRADAIKAADPSRLTFISLTGWSQARRAAAAEWCSVAEVAGPQIYPIGAPTGANIAPDQALAEAYRRNVLYVDAAAASGRPVITTMQTFTWGAQSSTPRFPTVMESRNMTYGALAAGAKGLIGYTFRDLQSQPALWSDLQQQAIEVAVLAPVLLDATRSRLATGNPLIAATTWVQGSQATTVVINLSPTASQTVSLPMPTGANNLQPLFASRPAGLMLSGGNLTGTVAAMGVHVYRMALTGLQTFRTTYDLASDGSHDLLTPAGDGVKNILKYAFNMIGTGTGQATTLSTPNTSMLAANGSAGLPLVGSGTGADAGKLKLSYVRRKASSGPGVSYNVEFSDVLASWAINASAVENVTSIDATFERVTVTDSLSAPAKRFVRVRVTTP